MSDFEITALVLAEHEVFRREFSALDDLSGQELAAAWEALHAKLEVHAVAEEQLFDVSTAGINYADTHHALPQDMPEPGRRGGPQFDEPGRTGAVGPRRPQRHRRSPGPRCGISPRSRC